MMRSMLAALAVLAMAACAPAAPSYDVAEKSIAQLQADMTSGAVTSEGLVQAYMARIAEIDDAGPTLNSVIALNPNALEQARALDAERAAGQVRGPLHGVPVLIKDNIETADNATTAGSLALANNNSGRDAPLVARLREAGAVILGKTNLSEWANIRASNSISGWSAAGGLTRNPYALDRNACGSSSGSGAAAAASLAAITIGTETDGSVVCPSSINGLVGIKPTVGLVSRTYVVPISHTQDTPGPMGRSVADVAAVLTVIAGSDPADPQTAQADARRADYSAALDAGALQGRRIGVLRFQAGFSDRVDERFDAALTHLREAGAEIVEITEAPAGLDAIGNDEFTILLSELKTHLDAYLAGTPTGVATRTLADVIAFNANTPAETTLFGQDIFERAQATQGTADPAYVAAIARAPRQAGQAIDALLRTHRVDALIAPTLGPAWTIDVINGDHFVGGGSSGLPAVSGYPHVTVPMGLVGGLPVGLSFIAEAWSEAKLLSFAYAYEQRASARVAPTYARSVEDLEAISAALRQPVAAD
ncbi:N-carbamoylputrescine amidase [alpha proteobacterium U9-1i]|nr:N-carbamoylputrescine amidase [alpha proteobacterium U9-1i]